METPNLWMTGAMIYRFGAPALFLSNGGLNFANLTLLSLYLSHYIHRSIIFPLQMQGGAPMPISVMLLAFSFCSWNGFQQSLSLTVVNEYDQSYTNSYRFLLGAALFVIGMAINIDADYSLMALKSKRSDKIEGSSDSQKQYKIPRGRFFELVSCANYFGEIVEWSGFAIACWNVTALSFALYTISNIGTRAITHHKWYQSTFKDYPKDRKAVIPFII
jgi:3-oxo-5-alpha-steroid 4-dehydrogenase 1